MAPNSRIERTGLGLLLTVVLVLGIVTIIKGQLGPAIPLLLAVPAIGWYLSQDSAVGQTLVSLAVVMLLNLCIVGSAFIHPGISLFLVVAGSLLVGYLSPMQWTPFFSLVIPLIGAVVYAWIAYPAAQEDGLVAVGMMLLIVVFTACGLVSAVCSAIGVSVRRQRSRPPHRIADLLGP